MANTCANNYLEQNKHYSSVNMKHVIFIINSYIWFSSVKKKRLFLTLTSFFSKKIRYFLTLEPHCSSDMQTIFFFYKNSYKNSKSSHLTFFVVFNVLLESKTGCECDKILYIYFINKKKTKYSVRDYKFIEKYK